MASRYADSGGEKRGTGDSEYSEMGKKGYHFHFYWNWEGNIEGEKALAREREGPRGEAEIIYIHIQ